MKKIALTGGIACGKSMTARRLAALGARIIDADAVTKKLQEPHAPIWEAYFAYFGKDILQTDSEELDRAKIADIIYNDDEKRRAVNSMAHPLVKQAMLLKAREAQSTAPDAKAIFFDVPLLFETGWDKDFDAVWVVSVPHQVQLERLMRRNNLPQEAAERMIDAQMPLAQKVARADVVIDNSGSEQRTHRQIDAAWAATKP